MSGDLGRDPEIRQALRRSAGVFVSMVLLAVVGLWWSKRRMPPPPADPTPVAPAIERTAKTGEALISIPASSGSVFATGRLLRQASSQLGKVGPVLTITR